jgi:hypothetical protein
MKSQDHNKHNLVKFGAMKYKVWHKITLGNSGLRSTKLAQDDLRTYTIMMYKINFVWSELWSTKTGTNEFLEVLDCEIKIGTKRTYNTELLTSNVIQFWKTHTKFKYRWWRQVAEKFANYKSTGQGVRPKEHYTVWCGWDIYEVPGAVMAVPLHIDACLTRTTSPLTGMSCGMCFVVSDTDTFVFVHRGLGLECEQVTMTSLLLSAPVYTRRKLCSHWKIWRTHDSS